MKKLSVCICALFLGMGILAGCSKNEEDMKYLKDFKADDYVELGDYKGIEVTAPKVEVSDEELENYIRYLLSANTTYNDITDRTTAQSGDVANIDYVGKKDGVEFDGGSAQGYDLELGSGVFIPGFEDGVVGMEVGSTKDIPLTFPDNYGNADLAGADVVFTVTLNALKEAATPELTDEYVASLGNGLSTVEEYKNDVRQTIADSYESSRNDTIEQSLTQQVIANATIKGAPSGFTDRLISTLMDEITETATNAGVEPGMVASYYYGVSQDNYEEELKTFVNDNLIPNYMVFGAIAQKEGIEVSDADIDADITEMLASNNSDMTVEEYKEQIGDVESYREYLTIMKTIEFLKDNAVITEEQ